MSNKINLSIITVLFNDLDRFIPTFENICKQIDESDYSSKVEYIVKDGKSNDGFGEFAKDSISSIENLEFISSEDSGIYSAMNQAVKQARGDYVIFINAGDKMLPNGIDTCFAHMGEEDILAFNFKLGNKQMCQNNFDGMLVHRSLCHQAIVSKRSITEFSESYELASDYKFLLNNRDKIKWLNESICVFGDEFKSKGYQRKINNEQIKILKNSNVPFLKKILSIIVLAIN